LRISRVSFMRQGVPPPSG